MLGPTVNWIGPSTRSDWSTCLLAMTASSISRCAIDVQLPHASRPSNALECCECQFLPLWPPAWDRRDESQRSSGRRFPHRAKRQQMGRRAPGRDPSRAQRWAPASCAWSGQTSSVRSWPSCPRTLCHCGRIASAWRGLCTWRDIARSCTLGLCWAVRP